MRKSILFLAFSFISFLSGYSQKAVLFQAAFDGKNYEFGYHSKPTIDIKGAPSDIDWERWSILFDGKMYRLYFMPIGRSDRLYQFGFNYYTEAYEFGHRSTPIIPVVGLPDDANLTSFSILYDSVDYRLYFKTGVKNRIYQCAYDSAYGNFGAYRFGYHSLREIPVLNAPPNTDWKNWTMLHDGKNYRLYFGNTKDKNQIIQFGFNGYGYSFGYQSIPYINIKGMPKLNFTDKFNITFDGIDYRLYKLLKP